MGQQQLLLIVLSVVLVGIAIAVGITMFQSNARQSNTDSLISDLMTIGTEAYKYKILPTSMGGGAGSFNNFHNHFSGLPENLRNNKNGVYSVEEDYISDDKQYVTIKATSNSYDELERWVLVAPTGMMSFYPNDEDNHINNEFILVSDEPSDSSSNNGGGKPTWAGGPPPWAKGPK